MCVKMYLLMNIAIISNTMDLSKTYLPSVSTWIHFTINFNITISVKMNVEPNGQPIHIFQLFTNDPYLTN